MTLYNIMHSTQQLKLSANYTSHPIHLGQPPGFTTLYEGSCPTHHGLYWCSNYRNTTVTCATHQRSERDAETHWGNTSFHHGPVNFLWRCTSFLQISMYWCPNRRWTILVINWMYQYRIMHNKLKYIKYLIWIYLTEISLHVSDI